MVFWLSRSGFHIKKACIRWLKEGDTNTRFLHGQFKQRRVHCYIHQMKDKNGVWVDELPKIEDMAVE